jgi:hypothetical protein
MKETALARSILVLGSLLAASLACGGPDLSPITPPASGEPRSYYLGFTPFPHDLSIEAVNFAYEKISSDADIIAHHFDNGVPWPEALAGEAYSENIRNDWEFRKANTPPGHKIYLAITPINLWRDGLAPYRGEEDDMPLPPPWDTYAFDHPDVMQAYLNYAVEAVEFFDPDYLAIGIESNLLVNSGPDLWPAYLRLHQHVYSELKARYPDLPVFASILGVALLEGYRDEDDPRAHLAALAELEAYSDLFAVSLYPYLTRYLAEELPADFWDELFGISDKPIAITETGFPAQAFAVLDGQVSVEGSPEKQAAFIQRLLAEAQQREFVFVINFILRDYDQLYEDLDEDMRALGILWRDTGLYDEDGRGRPALEIWRAALQQPRRSP